MSKKDIMLIGVTFALIFVASMGILAGSISIKADEANKELVRTLAKQNIIEEGDIVKGELVAVMLNNLVLLDDSIQCSVVVKTKENPEGKKYVVKREQKRVYECTDTRSMDYINPSADFLVGYKTNENGAISIIEFQQR